jgi:hypothetical protein
MSQSPVKGLRVTRLLIGNDFDEDLRDDRGWSGWWVQRIAWFARDHDVLVLPEHPEDAFLDYVTGLTGTDRSTLRVVVPPPGRLGDGLLTADRLTDPVFHDELRTVLAGRTVDSVVAMSPHASVSALARAIGAQSALSGGAFTSQGGGTLVSSKAVFRSVAAGAGVPLPAGAVCSNPAAAEDAITEQLDQGHIVVLKLEFRSGGRGNEVLSPIEGVRPVGARRTVVLSGRPAVHAYLEESWEWLTDGGRHQVVVERYFRDSAAYFVEFLIGDEGIELGGHGEMQSAPYYTAQIIPADLDPETLDRLIQGGRRMCVPLHAMGYRGMLSADAIVTPDRQVLYTEWNGRLTGSTHTYFILGDKVVGKDYASDRVLLEHVWPQGWATSSFQSTVDRLTAAKLAYDPATRTGVIVVSAYDKEHQGVMYCVVAPDIDMAWDVNDELNSLFATDS